MSRRKRGRTNPPKQPARRDESADAGSDALSLEYGGGELPSGLRLEIGVAAMPVGFEFVQPQAAPHADPAAQDHDPQQADLLLDAADAAPGMPAETGLASDRVAPFDADTLIAIAAVSASDDAPADLPAEQPHRRAAPPMRPLGLRFADARSALGLTTDDAAKRLRIPSPVLVDIEAERFQALGALIYARGYLRSYARLLELPEIVAAEAIAICAQSEPELQPTATTQHRAFAPRLATPALYALLTILLVVPVALQLYQRSHAPDPANAPAETAAAPSAREVPLDAPPQPASTPGPADVSATATAPGNGEELAATPQPAAPAPPVPSPASEPVLASLAPMPTRTPPTAGQHVLLKLAESSWVELTGADGSRIEYAMLPGGSAREYQVAGRASLRIGNIRGATLTIDGKPVDLAEFARANVARVSLGGDAAMAVPAQ